jgi:hypothetical protein
MKYAGVNAFLSGVRPCVIAMILATAIGMAISTLLGFTEIHCSLFQTDGRRHCRINHFAVTVTPATLIKDQNFF